jgi:hypothetical protein
MDQDEIPTHSFVVRIWAEETDLGRPGWRGHIIHVLGNEDRYFDELQAIPEFIRPFLVRMGARMDAAPRLRGWLRRLWMAHPPRPGG